MSATSRCLHCVRFSGPVKLFARMYTACKLLFAAPHSWPCVSSPCRKLNSKSNCVKCVSRDNCAGTVPVRSGKAATAKQQCTVKLQCSIVHATAVPKSNKHCPYNKKLNANSLQHWCLPQPHCLLSTACWLLLPGLAVITNLQQRAVMHGCAQATRKAGPAAGASRHTIAARQLPHLRCNTLLCLQLTALSTHCLSRASAPPGLPAPQFAVIWCLL